MGSANAVIRGHWQLLVFILGLVSVFWLLWVLLGVLLPSILGFFFACLLWPIISWVEKRLPGQGKAPQLKRISILLVVYLLVVAVIGLTVFYAITVMGEALFTMANDVPKVIPNGLDVIKQSVKSIPFLSSPTIQEQIDSLTLRASEALGDGLKDFLTRGVALAKSSSNMIIGLISMPILVFYILKDWERLRDRFYAALPLWALPHTKSVFSVIQHVTGRYLRAQLLLCLAVGLCAFIMLMILRVDYAVPLAIFAGITEAVPLIGPWLGGTVGILVTLSVAPEKVPWVASGYVLIQLLENSLLVPKIQGSQMQIHPALIIVISVLGAYFAGLVGFIIVLPLTMTIVGIFRYLRDSTRDGTIS